MITVFVFVAIGALIGWFVLPSGTDYVESVLLALICALVFLIVGSLVVMVIGTLLPSEYVLNKQIELVGMQDTAGIHGEFFLTDSRPHYVFYQKEGKGFKSGKLPVRKTVVYEEQRDDGLIKAYEKKFTSGWLYLIGFIDDEKYEIFVPKGSVLPQFHPDHPDSE